MDLVAGDQRDIVLALSVDDIAAFDQPDRFVAHLPLGGGLDPTWLDLFCEAVRSVTEQDDPVDFLDARSDLEGGPANVGAHRRARRQGVDRGRRRRPGRAARRARRALDRAARGGARPPAARGEALDPRPHRPDRRLRRAAPTARATSCSPGRSEGSRWPRSTSEPGRGTRTSGASERRPLPRSIRSAVPLTPETRTIEIGAGTGLLGLALVGEIGELVLAEPSSGMLEVAREKIARLGRPGVSAVSFDLTTDEPPVPPFDLAISLLVLHHLADTGPALAADPRAPAARRPPRALRPRRRGRDVPRCRCRGRPASLGSIVTRLEATARRGRVRRRRHAHGDDMGERARCLPAVPAHGPTTRGGCPVTSGQPAA